MDRRIYFSMGMEKIKKKMIEKIPNKKVQELLLEAENHHKSGHLDKLEKVLRKIISIDSSYFPALFNLARLLEMSKKWDEAIKLYKEALKLNPSHMETMFNLVNCYEDTNNLNQAIQISEKIYKLYPDKLRLTEVTPYELPYST